MIDSFRQTLIDYVLSGHAYLHAHTPEKTRFVQELKEVAAELPPEGRPIFVWSPAVGWQDAEGNPATTASGAELGQPNPQTAPQQILDLPEESLFVLKDFGCYLQSRTFAYFDIVVAWLSEIRDVLAHTGRTVIFVGVDFEIPPALQHDVTTIEFKIAERHSDREGRALCRRGPPHRRSIHAGPGYGLSRHDAAAGRGPYRAGATEVQEAQRPSGPADPQRESRSHPPDRPTGLPRPAGRWP